MRHVIASATGRFENCDHGGKDTEVSLVGQRHGGVSCHWRARATHPIAAGTVGSAAAARAPSPKGQLSWSGVLPAQRGAVLLGRHKHDA